MRATRRQVLGAGALLLATGCTACTGVPAPAPASAPAPVPVDPDDALRAAAVVRERQLVQAYDDAVLAAPSLAARLGPVRAEHVEHLAALTGPRSGATASPGAVPTATAGPGTPPPVPSPDGTAPPGVRAASPPATVLAGLVRVEQAAAAGHGTAVAGASRPLAALLAVLAASEASHQVVLG